MKQILIALLGLPVALWKIYGELFVYGGFANNQWDWFDIAMSGLMIIYSLWLFKQKTTPEPASPLRTAITLVTLIRTRTMFSSIRRLIMGRIHSSTL